MKKIIQTNHAPKAIGPYSQAVQADQTVYLSGQIALDPEHMTMVSGSTQDEAIQVMKNLSAVCEAAGGSLNQMVKLTIYLTDLADFDAVNQTMMTFFTEPYPARATVQVAKLPKNARIEMDGVMVL